jgi:FkbM family methyltransferase
MLSIIKKLKFIKNLIVERLEKIQTIVESLDGSASASLENQASLLQASIHLIEAHQQLARKTELIESQIKENQLQILRQAETNQQDILKQIDILFQANKTITVGTGQYPLLNPELGLLSFLYSYLPNRKALDIGANIGDVSACLLQSGYEVYAFEPFSPIFEKLNQRMTDRSKFHSYNFALGSRDGMREMHIATDSSGSDKYGDSSLYGSLVPHSMPEDLKFTSTIDVKVRSLESLHRSGDVPTDISLVKIDTEGNDLDVIQGMGRYKYPVVMSEFWDSATIFAHAGANNALPDLVKEMTERGYLWYIVLYRIWGENNSVSFYCNYSQSLEKSWGNVFFFQDHSIFNHARDWCTAVLPITYFKDLRY